MRSMVVVTVAALTALAGCGGGGNVPIGNFAKRNAEVYCAKTFDCCNATEIMEQFSIFSPPITTEAQCVTTFTAFGQLGIGQLQASIDAGRVVYNAGAAADCFAAVEDQTCAEYAAMIDDASCDAALEGQVAVDGACATDTECVSDYCEGESSGVDGACKAKPGDGEPCPDFDCAEGFHCDFNGMEQACTATSPDGTTCNGDSECTSGACVGGDPTMGTPGMCGTQTTCDGI